MPESVEAFVEHLIFLSRMTNEIASLEQEYNIVTRMYSIARNFEMTISAEELALYQTLMPSFQHLKVWFEWSHFRLSSLNWPPSAG